MSARNRIPRNGANKEDNEEELAMWNQIQATLRKLAPIQRRQQELSLEIITSDEKMAAEVRAGNKVSVAQMDAHSSLLREQIKLSSEEFGLLREEPHDLIKNMSILMALRDASATNQQPTNLLPKSRNKSKPALPRTEVDSVADSPTPQPQILQPTTSRLKAQNARSTSVTSTSARDRIPPLDPTTKADETSTEGTKGPSAERAGKFFVGAEVAYRQNKMKEDGSQWIQCNIINISEVGAKKRYEVQDPEPDETGAPGQIYKASASALIAIPPLGASLPEYPVGKQVLARYPETTTFYRAEVTRSKRDVCWLKFEDDQNQEMEVDRRFVLDFAGK